MDFTKLLPNYALQLSLLRTMLQGLGVLVGSYGYFTGAGEWDKFSDTIVMVVGGLIFIVTTIWSIFAHRQNALIAQTAALPNVQAVVTDAKTAASVANADVVPATPATAAAVAASSPVVRSFLPFILVPVLFMSLAACNTVNQAVDVVNRLSAVDNITMKDVYVLRAGYNAAVLAPAANYRRLPLCEKAAPPCAERAAVVALQKADRNAYAAIVALEKFVRENPGKLGATGLYDAAKLAVSQVQRVLADYRVNEVIAGN